MATFTSTQVTNKDLNPAATPHSSREVMCVRGTVALTDALAAGDFAKLVVLPPKTIAVECTLISTDLDTGTPAIIIDVGVLNTAEDGLVAGSLLIDGSAVCQAGGVARMDDHEHTHLASTWLAVSTGPGDDDEKIIAVEVMTVAATEAAGTIYFECFYRSSEGGT